MAQIASPGEMFVPGVMCARCRRTFSVRVKYTMREKSALPTHLGMADVHLILDIIDVEVHECMPPSNE